MPVLENPKHEMFVQHVIAGKSAADAYKLSGFRGKDAQKRASDLRTKPEIKGRIKELTTRTEKAAVRKAVRKLALTKEYVLEALMHNVEQGKKVKGGSSVLNRAAELLGKHLGMFEEQEKKPLDIEDLTADQIRQLLGDEAPPKPDIFQ